MIRKVSIRNFQSIENIELEFGRLTAIVGPSNVGKSSVMRALRAAVDNRRGDSFIRDGADSCSVTFIVSDSKNETAVKWAKPRKKSGEYLATGDINTPPLVKIDQQQFDRIVQLFDVELVKGVTFNPCFHHQLDQPFLISQSDSLKSKILGQITNATLILLANNDVKKQAIENDRWVQFYD